MPNFNEISSMKVEDVKKPVPPPTGNYLMAIVKLPESRKITVQGVEQEVVDFDCKVVSPYAGVDESALAAWQAEFGPITDMRPLQKTFFTDSPDGRFAMVSFCKDTLGATGSTVGELLANTMGRQFVGEVIHKPFQSKQSGQMELATNLGKTAKL